MARGLPRQCDVWLLEGGPDHESEVSQAFYRGRNVGLPDFDLDGCRTRRYGGSLNCWGGYCRLFDDLDFEVRPRIPNSGWPMSNDPYRGVVDGDCRVHNMHNLYVAGSSVFPTAGSGTPTLMIVALALRLADHLRSHVARVPMQDATA